jgi:hypothetical protein
MVAPSRLLMGLAPMLAVAALAAMPAVSQAAPHYYKSGVLIPEGERVPILEWGRLKLEYAPALAASTTCEIIAGGYVENAVGGGAGIGATLRDAAYNCTDAECPSGEFEVKGQKYEKEFEMSHPPQSFPWPSVLIEPEARVIRTSIAGVVMKEACVAHNLSRSTAGEGGSTGAGENEQFVLPSGGPPTLTCLADERWMQTPQTENGTNNGPNQSKVVFNAGAGALDCAGGAFPATSRESLKIMGYKGSELIAVH